LNLSFDNEIAENDGRTVTPTASNLFALVNELDVPTMVTTSHLAALSWGSKFIRSIPSELADDEYIPAIGPPAIMPTVGKVLLTGLS
jgi:hypothetical protein